jgi:hypothetical protein
VGLRRRAKAKPAAASAKPRAVDSAATYKTGSKSAASEPSAAVASTGASARA